MKAKNQIILFIFLFILITLFLNGKTVNLGVISEVNNPEMIVVQNDSLYVLDGIKVFEYDLKDLELKNSFGKEGNGPGEFRVNFINRLRMRLVKDRLMLSDFNKIAFFTLKGEFINEIRLPFGASQITPVGEDLVITRFMTGERGVNQMGVVLYDNQLNKKKILYTKPEITVERSRKLDAPNEMIFVNYDKYIYVADQKNFEVSVFDREGQLIRKIKKNVSEVKLTDQYKNEVMQWFEQSWAGRFKSYAESMNITKETMKKMIAFKEHFPAFRSVSLISGKICFETFIKKGRKSKFVIIDKKGVKEKSMYLTDAEPGRVKMMAKFTYTIDGGFYYFLNEDVENETWELMREKM